MSAPPEPRSGRPGPTPEEALSLPGPVHFAGVGGVGMAGVAYLLHALGREVSGCDAAEGPLFPWLRACGVDAVRGHDPAHVSGRPPAMVVRTPAVRDDAPELAAARAAGVPVFARGEILAALSARFRTFAVCGSHGKTTTSSFLSAILRAHRPDETWWCVGGTSGPAAAVAGAPSRAGAPAEAAGAAGREAPYLVAEADESDGTLARYRPYVAVVTNVDLDHADRFPDVASFEAVFSEAFARTERAVVYCADHPRAAALARASATAARRVSFGFSADADWRLSDWESEPGGTTRFVLSPPAESAGGRRRGIAVALPVPGRHNALNAAAAIAAAAFAGVAPEDAAATLSRGAVLPDRRFERVGSPDGFTVVSDYSHHPAEIAALIETARSMAPARLLAVFQPHRYTRTKALLEEFPPAFRGVDSLVLCPVYAASEDPLPGGTAADLYAAFRRHSEAPSPVLAPSLGAAAAFLAAEVRRGDMVLVVGAGNVDSLARPLADVHPQERDDPAPRLSAYGTAAPVPHLREVSTPEELRAALSEARARDLPVAVVASGTNTLVAGTGFRGVLVKLRREGFFFLSPHVEPGTDPDGPVRRLEVGAATPGATLLAYCRSFGLSGLEPMAGIPGQVGGWLAMNAGVRAGSFGDAVESALCIRISDGAQVRLPREELRFSYRSCAGLAGHVALSVRVRLRASAPEAVAAEMERFAAARTDFRGLRTCGSVFRNPGNGAPPAGALADAAGCKGLRAGGAFVADFHANVIAADRGATASDVLALVSLVRDRVRAASGVELVPELRVLD